MMKYFVDEKDISYATIAVEAKDAAEAEAIAKELYFSGKINWNEADVTCPKSISISHIARLNRKFLTAKFKD